VTARTPGPWRIGDAGTGIFGPKDGNTSPKTVAVRVSRANAVFIVEACNAHDRLEAALRDVLSWYEHSDVAYLISHKHGEQADYHRTVTQARAALSCTCVYGGADFFDATTNDPADCHRHGAEVE
jgi:hypothetical protein